VESGDGVLIIEKSRVGLGMRVSEFEGSVVKFG